MMEWRTATLALPLVLSLLAGCAPARTTGRTSCEPPPWPRPATANVKIRFTSDLPPSMAEQTGVPVAMNGELAVSVKSEAIERSPLRSRYTGNVDLKITDPQGQKTYVSIVASVDGEYDGPPGEGLSAAIRQLLTSLAMPARVLPSEQSSVQTPERGDGR